MSSRARSAAGIAPDESNPNSPNEVISMKVKLRSDTACEQAKRGAAMKERHERRTNAETVDIINQLLHFKFIYLANCMTTKYYFFYSTDSSIDSTSITIRLLPGNNSYVTATVHKTDLLILIFTL